MTNLSITATNLARLLKQRSAVDVETEKFKKHFKDLAIRDKCEIQYEAIEKISIQFASAHDEYKSNAY